MNKKDIAEEYFNKGYNCAQSIVAVFWPKININEEICVKSVAGFGSGMYVGSTCGVVTGAVLMIGLKFGNLNINDKESKKKVVRLVKLFIDKFKKKNSSIICRDLLNNRNRHAVDNIIPNKNRCSLLVIDGVEVLEEVFKVGEKEH